MCGKFLILIFIYLEKYSLKLTQILLYMKFQVNSCDRLEEIKERKKDGQRETISVLKPISNTLKMIEITGNKNSLAVSSVIP